MKTAVHASPITYAPPAPAPEPLDKYEWSYGDVDFVYSNKRSCSGPNLTPREASDLLVALMLR